LWRKVPLLRVEVAVELRVEAEVEELEPRRRRRRPQVILRPQPQLRHAELVALQAEVDEVDAEVTRQPQVLRRPLQPTVLLRLPYLRPQLMHQQQEAVEVLLAGAAAQPVGGVEVATLRQLQRKFLRRLRRARSLRHCRRSPASEFFGRRKARDIPSSTLTESLSPTAGSASFSQRTDVWATGAISGGSLLEREPLRISRSRCLSFESAIKATAKAERR
jgi:hypothetical protein